MLFTAHIPASTLVRMPVRMDRRDRKPRLRCSIAPKNPMTNPSVSPARNPKRTVRHATLHHTVSAFSQVTFSSSITSSPVPVYGLTAAATNTEIRKPPNGRAPVERSRLMIESPASPIDNIWTALLPTNAANGVPPIRLRPFQAVETARLSYIVSKVLPLLPAMLFDKLVLPIDMIHIAEKTEPIMEIVQALRRKRISTLCEVFLNLQNFRHITQLVCLYRVFSGP